MKTNEHCAFFCTSCNIYCINWSIFRMHHSCASLNQYLVVQFLGNAAVNICLLGSAAVNLSVWVKCFSSLLDFGPVLSDRTSRTEAAFSAFSKSEVRALWQPLQHIDFFIYFVITLVVCFRSLFIWKTHLCLSFNFLICLETLLQYSFLMMSSSLWSASP